VQRRFVIASFLTVLSGGLHAMERVVSLAPSVTETVLALGLEEALIARTRYCPGHEGAGKEILEDMVQPSVERLLGLRPDLILASDPTPEPVVHRLRDARLRVERLPTRDLASVRANLRRTGELLGAKAGGEKLADEVRRRIEAVERVTAPLPPGRRPRVVLFYGTHPEFCAGAGSFTGEMLACAGGRNVAADSATAWPSLGRERLLQWDPEVILISLTESAEELAEARTTVRGWESETGWNRLSAVRSGRIVFVTGSLLMIPGPRVGEAVETVARALHPELFAALQPRELHFLEP
jgi:iron complex transport system substrate-binding protein